MKQLLLVLFTALAAFAAEDAWTKVREVETGAELRIYKLNAKEPLVAKFDRASDESLIVLTKSEQLSIPKDEIDRIDRRTMQSGRVLEGTRVDRKIERSGAEITKNTIPGRTTSVTTGLKIPSRAGFETIYRRTPPDTGKEK